MTVNRNHDLEFFKVLRSDLGTSLDESMKGAMARWDVEPILAKIIKTKKNYDENFKAEMRKTYAEN